MFIGYQKIITMEFNKTTIINNIDYIINNKVKSKELYKWMLINKAKLRNIIITILENNKLFDDDYKDYIMLFESTDFNMMFRKYNKHIKYLAWSAFKKWKMTQSSYVTNKYNEL
jgi:hypothetical protein